MDRRSIHLILLILTPAEQTELHLQIFSQAASLFSDAALYHRLRRTKTAQAAANAASMNLALTADEIDYLDRVSRPFRK